MKGAYRLDLAYEGGRLIDKETGEIAQVPEGVHVRKNPDRTIHRVDLPFIKLHELPRDLKPNEYKIFSVICSKEHLRPSDNVIRHSNGVPAGVDDMMEWAGIDSLRAAQKAVQGLKEKNVLAKVEGKYILNWKIATVADNVIDKETYNLFE